MSVQPSKAKVVPAASTPPASTSAAAGPGGAEDTERRASADGRGSLRLHESGLHSLLGGLSKKNVRLARQRTAKSAAVFRRVAEAHQKGVADSRQEKAKEAFERLDADESGTISLEELGVYMREQGILVTDHDLEHFMRSVNKDHDATTLNFEEFYEVLGAFDPSEHESVATLLSHFMDRVTAHSIVQYAKNATPLWEQMQDDAEFAVPGGGLSWRVRLAQVVDGTAMQLVVMALLFIDVICVLGELFLGATPCPGGTSTPTRDSMLHYLHKISISVLYFFAAQCFCCFIAYGRRFFTSCSYMSDVVVIGVAIALEHIFHAKQADSSAGGGSDNASSLFIVILFWRVLRVLHAVVETVEIDTKQTALKLAEVEAADEEDHLQVMQELFTATEKVERHKEGLVAGLMDDAKLRELEERGDAAALRLLVHEERRKFLAIHLDWEHEVHELQLKYNKEGIEKLTKLREMKRHGSMDWEEHAEEHNARGRRNSRSGHDPQSRTLMRRLSGGGLSGSKRGKTAKDKAAAEATAGGDGKQEQEGAETETAGKDQATSL